MRITPPKSPHELRKFGLVMTVPLALIGGVLLWKGRMLAAWILLGLGLFFLLSGLLFPRLLGPIEKAWMWLAEIIGAVMTRVILTIVFYLVLTPIGLFMRLRGRDLLKMKLDPNADSYWEPVDPEGPATRPDKPY